jgi:hypothetical protein
MAARVAVWLDDTKSIREKKQSFGTRVCACSSRFRRFRDGPRRAAARARHALVGSVRVGFERLRGFYVP